MADIDVSKAAEPPKPVHIGGESIADRLLPHLKKIIIGAIIIAVILSGYYGYRAYQRSKEEQATAKLAKVLTVAQRDVAQPMDMVPEDPSNPSFPTNKERATAILDELAKTGTDKAGPMFRGGLLLDAGRIDEAITELGKCEKGKTLDNVVCRELLGIAHETKALAEKDAAAQQKGLETALATFVAMQSDEKGSRYVYAIYHQGRIKAHLEKFEEAKALFKKAKELAPVEPPRRRADEAPTFVEMIDHRLANLGGA